MLKTPGSFSHGAVRKILQTRLPDPAFWLWLCHLPACELGRVTEEALEVIAKGPSGSDAESKSGSSLGSSCDSPFASWRNSPPASQTHEAGVLEKHPLSPLPPVLIPTSFQRKQALLVGEPVSVPPPWSCLKPPTWSLHPGSALAFSTLVWVICVCKHFGGPEGSPALNAGGLWNSAVSRGHSRDPHAVSVPERVSVAAAPCDWRDANVERAPCPPRRETWPGADPSRGAAKRRQRRRQRRRRARNLPPRPQLPGVAAEPPEKVCKLPAGAARTPGSPRGRAGGSLPPGAEPAAATSPAGLPAAAGGRARPGRGRGPRGALGCRCRRRELEGGAARCALTPAAVSCLRPVLAGIVTPPTPTPRRCPQMTAPAFAAAARRQLPGPRGGAFLWRQISPRNRLNFSRSS
ncbi:uncharacterized protein LOC144288437 [Canis aureus]